MADLPDLGFSTSKLRELWSAEAHVRSMLEVEVALARAGARSGVVPSDALARIEAAAAEPVARSEALLAEGWRVGTPLVPLLILLRARVGAQAAPYLHLGATSQDILDTAAMLRVRASLVTIHDELSSLADALHTHLLGNRDARVIGRTLLQAAVPMQLALRIARWLDPILQQLEGLESACAKLPIQLGGPVGDLATFGPHAAVIARDFAQLLRLRVPRLPWHSDRSIVVDVVQLATATAQACASIASNLILLSQPEIAELVVGDAGGVSSSMPHKRNPHHAVRAVAAARACHGVATVITLAPPHELERAAGSWHAEWFALPLVMQTAGAAANATRTALESSSFDLERAARNLDGQHAHLPAGNAASSQLVEAVVARYRALRGPRSPWRCE